MSSSPPFVAKRLARSRHSAHLRFSVALHHHHGAAPAAAAAVMPAVECHPHSSAAIADDTYPTQATVPERRCHLGTVRISIYKILPGLCLARDSGEWSEASSPDIYILTLSVAMVVEIGKRA